MLRIRRSGQGPRRSQRHTDMIQRVTFAQDNVCRYTDRELCELSSSIRRSPSSGEDWIRLWPQALGLVSEATRRITGTDVTQSQVLAGISLLDGAVVELSDGEGKGIAAILAAYVSVLAGMHVHVVTLSEYLARRDVIRAQSILGSLGIATSLLGTRMPDSEVTFGSYSGFVVQYLRENMTAEADESIESHRDFAIVDEADTIMIDEARRLVQIRAEPSGERQIVSYGTSCDETSVVESQTVLGECRVRNYFSAYRKLAGLTATARPATSQFKHFYGLEVVSVPVSVSSNRVDHDDLWYAGTQRMLADLELNAIDRHARRQPVFIRAESESICREISQRLSGRGVAHSVLQPGDDRVIAKIMAEAGKPDAVTIAVGSSGRGYGIRLGGDISYAAEERAFGGGKEADLSAASSQKLRAARNAVRDDIAAHRAEAMAAGGLVVLGALRSGSARADDWLRGLAGQRGEPGESRFYISSDEYALSLPPNGALVKEETKRNSPPIAVNKSLRGRFFQSMINDVYRGTEATSFTFRRKLAEFDDLVYARQEQAYALRKSILLGVSCDELITWVTDHEVALDEQLGRLFSAAKLVSADVHAAIEGRAGEVGYANMYSAARRAGLSSFDRRWSKYLKDVHELYDLIPLNRNSVDDEATYENFLSSIDTAFRDVMMHIRLDTVAGLFS